AARPARDDAHALAADVDLVTVARGLVALELEPDEDALRVRGPLLERGAADEVVVRLKVHREPDARLEGVDLVVELVAGEDQPRLDAEDVQRLEPEGSQAVVGTGFPDRVPDRRAVRRMAPHLLAEPAGVTGARDDYRDPVVGADAPDREAEPLEILERRLRRRRPHDLREQRAALRPLNCDVVELVGRGLHPDLQAVPLRELVQPDAVVL